ncbi:SDR family oxidoreductase [Phyllobacterium sp. 21LDTY02-6]|uniref:SDR family oxidoreductase n=1 Tax=Phyllobacterium sp. 21LDTY02-6 TaxID=2944903 RepID=UPI0020204E1D|nr:SDR family oxidoreductase [Phyllobacterium sp. 21LDTY02-6]MCO4317778.1 SDR family oxidoreductase [Phyllobacterium sp. 21LDTY02-6]
MTPSKTILITGGSSGMGAYCARALKADGWTVFVTARREFDIDALRDEGFSAHYLDYRDSASIASTLAAVLESTGGTLDALYNNGAYAIPGAVEDLPVAALREQFDVAFFGWHELTRLVIPVMRRQGHGRIVHCSSILGLVPMKWRGAYVAAKFALEGLMTTQRMELEGSGIHVSLLEPGSIETRFRANAIEHVESHIDTGSSPHADVYRREIEHARTGRRQPFALGPEAIYKVLKHALESKRPRPHYIVTLPAKFADLARRLLPSRALYRLLAGKS